MNINELIKLLENRLATLEMNKIAAINAGDLDYVLSIEQTIEETKVILDKLL